MKSIVVLDDNAGVREGVAKVLRDGGYRPLAASNDGEALRAVTEHEPAAVIVDLLMSGIDGRGFLDRLARLDPERGIPVISHTAICEIGDLLEVTREWGKVWTVTKPATRDALLSAVAAAVSTGDGDEDADGANPGAGSEAEALTDHLTGLPNRPALEEVFVRLLAGARRYNRAIGVAIVAVDDLDGLEAGHGEETRDAVLKDVGAYLRRLCRVCDFVGRFGAGSFIVLLPETPVSGVRIATERLRAGIAGLDCGVPGGVTASFGCAGFPGHGDDPDVLIKAAESALEETSQSGRDRVELPDLAV